MAAILQSVVNKGARAAVEVASAGEDRACDDVLSDKVCQPIAAQKENVFSMEGKRPFCFPIFPRVEKVKVNRRRPRRTEVAAEDMGERMAAGFLLSLAEGDAAYLCQPGVVVGQLVEDPFAQEVQPRIAQVRAVERAADYQCAHRGGPQPVQCRFR